MDASLTNPFSIKYNEIKEGNAMIIIIITGTIVQINSIKEPCDKYLCDIGELLIL
jgi:hypothetical protein